MSPLPSSFPQLFMLSMTSYGIEHPFGQLGSAVPAVSEPKPAHTRTAAAPDSGSFIPLQVSHCPSAPLTVLSHLLAMEQKGSW